MGPHQCIRPAFPSTVSPLSDTNGLSSSSTSSAGRARAHSDRNAGRPLWRPCCFHRSDVLCRRAGGLGPGRYQLPESARCGVPSRNGGVFICCWRRVRLPLVFHGEPRQCARRVWIREYWPVRCGLPWAGGSCRVRISHCLLGNVGHPFGLGSACSSSLLETLPTLLVPRVSRRCSAYSHANLWRGRSPLSIF